MAKQTFTTGQVLTAAQVNSLQANDFNQTVSAKTASYVLVASDKGTRIEFNTSGSVTCTVNTGLFDAGDTVYIQNRGAGVVTITAGTATVNTSASLALNQWEGGVLYFISASASVWYEYASNANGDITGITTGATSGLTGGVTSGTADLKLNVTAKGDLLVGTGSGAVSALAVATEGGSTLVADSSTNTGLRWQGNFAAGKNAIINGDFRINQRNFSSATAAGTYGFDRWVLDLTGGTVTYSAQTFTPGTAPVAGYEGVNFARIATSGQSTAGQFSALAQKIEDVRSFAGQTVTISFWAKANTGTPSVAATLYQVFGSGGSANVTNPFGKVAITTSWARYSLTATLPSLSGKTIGTSSLLSLYFFTSAGSNFNTDASTLGIQNNTIDFWGVQVEAGNVATAFQTATGTLAGELAACQRYFQRMSSANNSVTYFGVANYYSTTAVYMVNNLPVVMRGTPSVSYSTASTFLISTAGTGRTATAVVQDNPVSHTIATIFTTSAGTAGQIGNVNANFSTSATIDISAEL